jgi:hypothetical protein
VGMPAVVDPKRHVGGGAQFRDRFKEVRVEHLGSVAPIEGCDVRVLIGLPRLNVVRRRTGLCTPVDKGLGSIFGPFSTRTADGHTRPRVSRARTKSSPAASFDLLVVVLSTALLHFFSTLRGPVSCTRASSVHDPTKRPDPVELLDIELHCQGSACPAREIRIRLEPHRQDWLQSLHSQKWYCPLCREPVTLRWVQAAAVTEQLEPAPRSTTAQPRDVPEPNRRHRR